MKAKGSLLCSQQPTSGAYPEPDTSSSALQHNLYTCGILLTPFVPNML